MHVATSATVVSGLLYSQRMPQGSNLLQQPARMLQINAALPKPQVPCTRSLTLKATSRQLSMPACSYSNTNAHNAHYAQHLAGNQSRSVIAHGAIAAARAAAGSSGNGSSCGGRAGRISPGRSTYLQRRKRRESVQLTSVEHITNCMPGTASHHRERMHALDVNTLLLSWLLHAARHGIF